jgi:hypothetical protein
MTHAPLKDESLDKGDRKKKTYADKLKALRERQGTLTKADVYYDLVSNFDLDVTSCNIVWDLAEQIEKGGEGSRGGKVIGHTKSGKPIYGDKSADHYKDYSTQDHRDAADAHHKHAGKREEQEGVSGRLTANRHRDSHIKKFQD